MICLCILGIYIREHLLNIISFETIKRVLLFKHSHLRYLKCPAFVLAYHPCFCTDETNYLHITPTYLCLSLSQLGETNPHFEMCFLELVKNQRHPPPKRLVERPKVVADVSAQSDAEKGHDPHWLTTRPFTAPPRRSLMNMVRLTSLYRIL